ncbi:MAG: DUF1553 domain-containing protein, partial [Tepidisphaeraceae bacterium]
GAAGNSAPFIPAPVGETARKQLIDLEGNVTSAEGTLAAMQPAIDAAQTKWERTFAGESQSASLRQGLIAHYPLDGSPFDAVAPCRGGDFRDGEAKFAPGMLKHSADFDGKTLIDLGDVGRFEKTDPFTLAAWVFPTDATNAAFIARMDEKNKERGYNLYWQNGLIHFQILNQVPDNMITLVSAAVPANRWHHVVGTYDGSGKAAGMKVYLDGKPLAMTVGSDTLTGSIVANRVPLQIGARAPGATRFIGKIDEVRIYNRALTADEALAMGGPRVVAANMPAANRSPELAAAVRQHFLETAAPQDQRDAIAKADTTRAERKKVLDVTPTVMVMQEMPTPRDTFVLKRGQYDQHGEKVTAGVPASLPPLPALPAGETLSRVTLAKWLVDPKNPLTSRVTVNRFWEMYFGAGIVKSTEDFGAQSEFPSHPDLLDWLAVEFVRGGWDMKAMQKLIVNSATYRQASKVTPEMLEKDPDNRLLARGPRLRLSAEAIRDQALLASGLLVEKVGGPSVRPYQPPGIWEEVTSGGEVKYVQDHGEALYRRSMYTFWKRTVPPPTMSVFDAPTREVCTVRRSRTNTPLQALALLNDTVYVEAARKLAERAINEGGPKPSDRIARAFQLAVARKPSDAEMKVLVDGFNAHLATYFSDPEAAAKLLAVGESARNPNLDPRELAAYTAVSGVILNMDQTITRE